jgi:hypothetical protein
MADAGADFRDVYRFFLTDSDDPRAAYHQAVRVFRGSLPVGAGPFPKDAMYALGLVRLLRVARSADAIDLHLLFAGKAAPADLPLLASLHAAGLLSRPAILPPPFGDAAALAARIHALPHLPHPLQPPHVRSDGILALSNPPLATPGLDN